jgi:16S rRNA (cytosine967-C5)-methyltransferase
MAFEVLRSVEERRGEPATLLNAPRYRSLERNDRDLATEIVLGVLRHRGSLDWILARHVRRPLDSLDPTLLTALRIGLYQIRHLDRVPARAAVDESVRVAHAFGASRGSGLVNATLRSVLRDPERPALPQKEADALEYLTSALSHPRWLAARYLARLGVEGAETLCRKQNEPPPLHLRLSPRISPARATEMLAESGIRVEAVPQVPGCLKTSSSYGSLRDTVLYREGLVFPQDAGSQLVPYLLDLATSDVLLDVCAAPGGKATAAAARLSHGRVIALEKRFRRARILSETIRRLSAENVYTVVGDGTRIPLLPSFARILVDVPCTSVGTLRRNPDIKWRVVEADLLEIPKLQLEILDSASRLLARGGRLVYATCSTEPEENENVVERFLSIRRGFELVNVRESLPEAARHLVTPDGAFRTRPDRDDMDGYFAVALGRTESR